METRNAKISSCKSGGTAGAGSKTYKLTLPSSWVKQLDSSEVTLSFDGEKITIAPRQTTEEFITSRIAKKHEIIVIRFYNKDDLCTLIYADKTTHEIVAENHTKTNIFTAFGKNSSPSWNDLENFLEDRCVPRTRAGIDHYLDSWGLLEYDPWDIVAKTHGRMAEDNQWFDIEVIR